MVAVRRQDEATLASQICCRTLMTSKIPSFSFRYAYNVLGGGCTTQPWSLEEKKTARKKNLAKNARTKNVRLDLIGFFFVLVNDDFCILAIS